MSKELKRFYREYLAWVEAGAPLHPNFTSERGLCRNLIDWAVKAGIGRRYFELSEEQGSLFIAAGLSHLFPFHRDDADAYHNECYRRAAHENPYRIAWVREHSA